MVVTVGRRRQQRRESVDSPTVTLQRVERLAQHPAADLVDGAPAAPARRLPEHGRGAPGPPPAVVRRRALARRNARGHGGACPASRPPRPPPRLVSSRADALMMEAPNERSVRLQVRFQFPRSRPDTDTACRRGRSLDAPPGGQSCDDGPLPAPRPCPPHPRLACGRWRPRKTDRLRSGASHLAVSAAYTAYTKSPSARRAWCGSGSARSSARSPSCLAPITGDEAVPLESAALEQKKGRCEGCGGALWQGRPRRLQAPPRHLPAGAARLARRLHARGDRPRPLAA
jgi:hypothetical protein